MESLAAVLSVAIPTFVVACMLAAGLGLSVQELIAPMRNVRLVLAALIVNFLVTPALALGLTATFGLHEPFEIGLLLLSSAAGAPFLPKLAQAAKGDLAFSVGLMLLLMVGSVVFMPLALPLMIRGISAEPWPILKPLLITMLLPLAAGMVLCGRWSVLAARLRPIISTISNLSMYLSVLLLVILNYQPMLYTFGTGAALVGALFVALSFLAGYLLGGPAPATRVVLGLGTGQRNIAAALLLATEKFDEPGVAVMLLVTTLAGIVVLMTAIRVLRRRKTDLPHPGASHGQE